MTRYLVTTADELSWRHDTPLLFLGEWCLREDRTEIWSRLNYEVASPNHFYGNARNAEIDRIFNITSRVVSDLSRAMNEIHGEDHSERYWQIILMAWVHKLVNLVANRYNALTRVINTHDISGMTCIAHGTNDLVANDLRSFIYFTDRDRWDHHLYSLILRLMENVPFPIFDVAQKEAEIVDPMLNHWRGGIPEKKRSPVLSAKQLELFGKRVAKFLFARVFPTFCNSTDAFIISSYFSVLDELKLQLMLKQMPQFREQKSIPAFSIDPGIRSKLNLCLDTYSELERIVRSLVPILIPLCYLDGYKSLKETVGALSWPAKPKFIYTANNFETDEVFKVWTAEKVEQGVPYYVGQHGNNYGTTYGSQYFPELITCDRFFSWGWKQASGYKSDKIVPAFNFKVVSRKQRCYDKQGGLVLVQRSPGVQWGPTDRYQESIIQQKQSLAFFGSLPLNLKKATTIRLHKATPEKDTNDIKLWRDLCPSINLDFGVDSIFKLFVRSRLVAFTYDSTGMLETLSLNIPTICFWNGGTENLIESAKQHYAMLSDVGILYTDPLEAAYTVKRIWADVDDWWRSNSVQSARFAFCETYSKQEKLPLVRLKDLLLTYSAMDSETAPQC